jgi:putative ABC transport system permease protein
VGALRLRLLRKTGWWAATRATTWDRPYIGTQEIALINRMVINNLGRRPLRTALSVIAVMVEVLLIISVVGLVTGLLGEMAQRQRGIGADIIVQPSGVSPFMVFSSAPMPVAIAGRLKQAPGVAAVTPVFMQTFGGLTLAYGIDPASFSAVTGGFQVRAGRGIQSDFDLMVDDVYANDNHIQVGSTQKLWDHDFQVVGIVQHGKGARLFVSLATMQDLLGARGKASVFYVRLTDPALTNTVLAEFKKLLPGYTISSMEEFTSLMMEGGIPGVGPFKVVMIGIAVVIGFLVIFLAMYTTVLERTREIGVLKSLGASKAYIVNIILRETLLVAIAGIVLGIGTALLLRWAVVRSFPTLTILITRNWLIGAALIAIGGALIGAFYPALRAARQDPIQALAYE